MLKELLKEIRDVNLCTWYLLPIIGLNRFSFDGVFVNSYLEKNHLWIIVQVVDICLVDSEYRSHANRVWNNPTGGFLAYGLPDHYKDDIQAYIDGRYSQFSEELKTIIINRSGLAYREFQEDGALNTDFRLMAIKGQQELREFLASELGEHVDSLPDDLLPVPPPQSFMDVTEV